MLASRKDDGDPEALREWRGPELASLGWMLGRRIARGSLLRARMGRAQGLVFCERNVRVLHARHVSAGRDLNLEEGCQIMGLSRRGIAFGDRCTVGRYAMISPTNIFGGELGEGLQVGDNSNIGHFAFVGCSGYIEIGARVLMGPRVTLLGENHDFLQRGAADQAAGRHPDGHRHPRRLLAGGRLRRPGRRIRRERVGRRRWLGGDKRCAGDDRGGRRSGPRRAGADARVVRILVVNNFVRHGSGIDASVDLEVRYLAARGHDVSVFRRDNRDFEQATAVRRAAMLASSVYSVAAYREMDRMLARERFDVVHLHNLVPFITGAAYDACRSHGVPTVQHLRNYRAFCLSSYAFRDGRRCDDCVRTAFLACAVHRCYRGSPVASAGLVAARWIDAARGRRYGGAASLYIADSRHTAEVHAAHGLPQGAHRGAAQPRRRPRGAPPCRRVAGATRRDRRQAEAHLRRLAHPTPKVRRWSSISRRRSPSSTRTSSARARTSRRLREAARRRRLTNVTFRGLLSGRDKAVAWSDSFLTVVPSLWDEPFGLVVPESYSLGVPVLATGAGGLAETVADGETGLRLDPRDIADAASRVRGLLARRSAVPAYARRRASGLRGAFHGDRLRAPAGGPAAASRRGALVRLALVGTRGVPAAYSGFETAVENIGRRLAARGHDVTVYCRPHMVEGRYDRYEGMRLVYLPTVRSKHLDTFVHTFISTVHMALFVRPNAAVYFIAGNSPFALLSRLLGVPSILNVDGLDSRRAKWSGSAKYYLRWAERNASRFATRVITDSTGAAARVPRGARRRDDVRPLRRRHP